MAKKIEVLAEKLARLELTRPSALNEKARTAYLIMQELRVPPWFRADKGKSKRRR